MESDLLDCQMANVREASEADSAVGLNDDLCDAAIVASHSQPDFWRKLQRASNKISDRVHVADNDDEFVFLLLTLRSLRFLCLREGGHEAFPRATLLLRFLHVFLFSLFPSRYSLVIDVPLEVASEAGLHPGTILDEGGGQDFAFLYPSLSMRSRKNWVALVEERVIGWPIHVRKFLGNNAGCLLSSQHAGRNEGRVDDLHLPISVLLNTSSSLSQSLSSQSGLFTPELGESMLCILQVILAMANQQNVLYLALSLHLLLCRRMATVPIWIPASSPGYCWAHHGLVVGFGHSIIEPLFPSR
mmetsp:Transcript_15267/g.32976  ORF Transcript_15267/g.32976 Transcript_15267/m.32976 type:complete len:301 (+) Transcript_15267:114-1016(+)